MPFKTANFSAKQMVNNLTEKLLYIHLYLRYGLFELQFT